MDYINKHREWLQAIAGFIGSMILGILCTLEAIYLQPLIGFWSILVIILTLLLMIPLAYGVEKIYRPYLEN